MTHTPYITTFIAGAKREALSADFFAPYQTLFGANATQEWQKMGKALDVFHAEPLDDFAGLHTAMDAMQVDVITQQVAHRRKQLLIADMDSTLIEQECIDEMAAMLGLKESIAAITARAMNGELAFDAALRERVGLLKGLSENDLQRVYAERITLMPGAKTLADAMKHHGAYLVIVSGGFTFFTDRVMEALGFDEARSNQLEWADGTLTGEVIPPIFDQESKLNSLHEICQVKHIPLESVLAIGDGANDVPMLKAAGLGIACHAKPFVRAQVQASLNHSHLDALLYVLGVGEK